VYTVAVCRKIILKIVKDVNSDIFRGWIDRLKIGVLVKIVMIEGIKYLFYCILNCPEINSHAEVIKFSSLDGNLDFPVVAMGPFTVPRVIS
jgi:hypothetical protein